MDDMPNDDYRRQYAAAVEPVRYAAKPTSDVAGLLRAYKERPHDDTTRLVLADALEEAGGPLGDIVRSTQPQGLHGHYFRQRSPSHPLSHLTPVGAEHGFLLGYTGGDLQHDWNGIRLFAAPIDPDAKLKAEPKLTRQGLRRFLPVYFEKHLGRKATADFVRSLSTPETAERMEKSLKAGEYFNDSYVRRTSAESADHPSSTLWPDDVPPQDSHEAWQHLVHSKWPKDEYQHAYADWLDAHGDPLADLIRRPARDERGTEGGMAAEFPHRNFTVGLRRFGSHDGSPMIRVKAELQHPSGLEYPLDEYGQRHRQAPWINWSMHMRPDAAKRWAEKFAHVGRAPELVQHLHDTINRLAAEPDTDA